MLGFLKLLAECSAPYFTTRKQIFYPPISTSLYSLPFSHIRSHLVNCFGLELGSLQLVIDQNR